MATTNPTIVVKITHDTEIRRFTMPVSALTWDAITTRATEAFDLARKNFKLTYIDEESDRITISSDEELTEALSLALHSNPAVLRLAVHHDATSKKAKHAGPAHAAEDKSEQTDKTDKTEPSDKTNGAAPGGPPEIAAFVDTLAKQLPALIGQFPPALRNLIPHAELDLAATLAANAAAATAEHVPRGQESCTKPPPEGVHPGVTCDKSGMVPIVGNRYHLVGHNYDLCEAEYEKLDSKEKAGFICIPPTVKSGPGIPCGGASCPAKVGLHPGVECDRSGMCPIVGTRYKLRGENYDLCEAEYEKLPATEKLMYDAIDPPAFGVPPVAAAAAGLWRSRWCPRRNMPPGMGGAGHKQEGQGCGPKLAARFVRDVTIFDGTQMTPGTSFTKIWRLKNVGEVPWPSGTRIVFVGGDQMTRELSVPLGRGMPVMPGEEVDAAVEMQAPTELGRYLGYWRLTTPMRRKFGQRIWCHVQVVDPTAPPEMPTDEAAIASTYAEIAKKKSDLARANEPDQPDDDAEPATTAGPTASHESTKMKKDDDNHREAPAAPEAQGATEAPPVVPAAVLPTPTETDDFAKDDTASDDGVLVTTEGIPVDAANTKPSAPVNAADGAEPGPSGVDKEMPVEFSTTSHLRAMGFTDDALIQTAIIKHGDDVEACARDLVAASEWDSLLDDLAEMGFENRELNKTLMLKNSGNIKRTVKDLVEA